MSKPNSISILKLDTPHDAYQRLLDSHRRREREFAERKRVFESGAKPEAPAPSPEPNWREHNERVCQQVEIDQQMWAAERDRLALQAKLESEAQIKEWRKLQIPQARAAIADVDRRVALGYRLAREERLRREQAGGD